MPPFHLPPPSSSITTSVTTNVPAPASTSATPHSSNSLPEAAGINAENEAALAAMGAEGVAEAVRVLCVTVCAVCYVLCVLSLISLSLAFDVLN